MRVFGIRTSVLLAALAAPALGACIGSDDQGSEKGQLGTLNLSLTGTSNSGVQYRLSTAVFAVTGSTTINLTSNADPTATSIRHELAAGQYLARLKAGWVLEKSTMGVFAPVNAVLVSPNPVGFEIVDQGVTPVVFSFRAGDDVVQLGNGIVDISIDIDDSDCAPNETACGTACVDINNDPANCGACGAVCGDAMGNPGACFAGTCVNNCPTPLVDCGGGLCVDVQSDPANCGACGATCGDPGMGNPGVCQNGQCIAVCAPGLTFCNGVCVNTTTDPLNCGGCGFACASLICINGTCF